MTFTPWGQVHFNPSPPELTLYGRRKAGVNGGADPTSIGAMAKLAITRVRYGLAWASYVDPRLFAADRTTLDPVNGKTIAQWYAIDRATFATAGIDVLTNIHHPPTGMSLTTGIAQMPSFMAGLAAAFPGSAWEVLNEMTSDDSFNGAWFDISNPSLTDTDRGTSYGQLMQPVYDAMKAADATCTVVIGGIDHGYTAFRTGLLVHATGKFDGFSIHAYGPPAHINLDSSIDECKSILGTVPLWITEFGSNYASDTEQAADIGACLAYIDQHCTTGDRYYVYRLIEDGTTLGVVNADGTFRHAAMLLMDRTLL